LPIARLVELLHDHAVNGVILSAKHIYFGQVEKVIQACELEGVEVWLLADFFKTEISQTTLDDFQGRPMLVFRSTPEASWQALSKEVLTLSERRCCCCCSRLSCCWPPSLSNSLRPDRFFSASSAAV